MIKLKVLNEDSQEVEILVNPDNIVSVEYTNTWTNGDVSWNEYTIYLSDGRYHRLTEDMYYRQFS